MCAASVLSVGSSPRVRGTAATGRYGARRSRFIPACAGNGIATANRSCSRSVHPRVCGERSWWRRRHPCASGSSPRVRGTGGHAVGLSVMCRFIPACAGNGWGWPSATVLGPVHPRVCGERVLSASETEGDAGSSPRVRGTANRLVARAASHRFIPACAGNGLSGSSLVAREPVHPRVCGERLARLPVRDQLIGSSPRVRGTDQRPAA